MNFLNKTLVASVALVMFSGNSQAALIENTPTSAHAEIQHNLQILMAQIHHPELAREQALAILRQHPQMETSELLVARDKQLMALEAAKESE